MAVRQAYADAEVLAAALRVLKAFHGLDTAQKLVTAMMLRSGAREGPTMMAMMVRASRKVGFNMDDGTDSAAAMGFDFEEMTSR